MTAWGGVRARVDHTLEILCSVAGLFVLPVSLLLFLQWPLRDWVQAFSREANDLAQWLFALYCSIAIVHASRQRSHLAADALARRFSPQRRRLLHRLSSVFVLIPWSLFLLYTSAPMVWQSIQQWERFPETFNPGYFIVKLSVALLGVMVLLQAWLDLSATERD